MFKSLAMALAAVLSIGTFVTPLSADDAATGVETSANVGMYSDYRFRGVSFTDGDAAIQGGFDVDFGNGFSAGVWASNIESFNGSEIELDPYAFYSFGAGEGSIDVGVTLYTFPGADDSHFVEVSASTSQPVLGADVTFGVAYVPEQDNVGNDDNVYVFAGAEKALPNTAFTVNFGAGYEDGAFGDAKLDWHAGLSTEWNGLTFGAQYVDTNTDSDATESTVVFSVSRSF
jgi:uncharacterized protein (TIGR02001 family)